MLHYSTGQISFLHLFKFAETCVFGKQLVLSLVTTLYESLLIPKLQEPICRVPLIQLSCTPTYIQQIHLCRFTVRFCFLNPALSEKLKFFVICVNQKTSRFLSCKIKIPLAYTLIICLRDRLNKLKKYIINYIQC